jgi:ParB family transcriptional regulator, chromosome partitioning protein
MNSPTVEMIEIAKIHVLNPRARSKKVFKGIAENIMSVGLKRPITITPCHSKVAGKDYDLVCGQGRLEAFEACGQTHIPAIVIEASEEDTLVMSLVENCARTHHRAVDLMQAIGILRQQGYTVEEIGTKTGLSTDYIGGIIHLLETGEERLITAVEAGHIPLTTAIQIANTPDEEVQKMLRELFETEQLSGRKLMVARKLIETRRTSGKSYHERVSGKHVPRRPITVNEVLRVYKKEAGRKRLLTRKAEVVSSHLLFVTEALKSLFKEEHFMTILKAEGLMTLPKPLSYLVHGKD